MLPLQSRAGARLPFELGQEVTLTWAGEMMAVAGMETATNSSAPVSVPTGVCQGLVFAEDRGQATGRAFWELPLLAVN
jgi:hypothetical protein